MGKAPKTKSKYVAPSLFEKIAETLPQPNSVMVEPETQTPAPPEAIVVQPPSTVAKKQPLNPQTCVTLRDLEILSIDDQVTIDDGILTGILRETHKQGQVFVIEKMTPWVNCESGMLVIAARIDDREKKTLGIGGKGIDANWFKPINK